MRFNEKLNEYINRLECTAKDLGNAAGISASTLSRYRSGERVPDMNSEIFDNLCSAIVQIANQKGICDIEKESVCEDFFQCSDFISTNKERLCQNFNALISVLNLNITKLCQYTSYDSSSISRFRNGTRSPADPENFASSVAEYVSNKVTAANDRTVLANLLECHVDNLMRTDECFKRVKNWLINGENTSRSGSSIFKFLNKLDTFDLNEYIKVIKFDKMKVSTVPFQLPISKTYYGIDEMMASELDFLKATVLSKSVKPVTMYSDMPMTEMAKDPEFPKKWMFGMAMLLKKGLHLNQIHNLDRPFDEMMLGLEGWIPMYMTGQISPYYLKDEHSKVFHHFLKVSGAAALSGEAIFGYHSEGRYYLSKTKEDIEYYSKRAEELLHNAHSLMDIYREDSMGKLNAFLLADATTKGKRRSIMSSLPIYTMDESYLKRLLKNRSIPLEEQQKIINFAATQREIIEKILDFETIEDSIPYISKEEFNLRPICLTLSGMFYDQDIYYTYEEYLEHLNQTKKFANSHPNYIVNQSASSPFQNLQIMMHEGQWAMISKGNVPAIHFVIHHPKLRNAIENFVPPIIDE